MIKRITSLVVSIILFSISLSSTYAAELPQEVKQNKLLSLAYIMTFTNPYGDQHFAIQTTP